MSATYLNALGVVCALGAGKAAVAEALFAGDADGLQAEAGWIPGHAPPLGAVRTPLPAVPATVRATRDNRCNRLLLAAAREIETDVQTAISMFGQHRIGVLIGTSTGGIEEATDGLATQRHDGAWPADYRYAHQELAGPAECLAEWLELAGPCYAISTACTAGARAIISAQRLLQAGLCDAVVCGGVDSLARLPLNGFHALGAMDAAPCNPFSRERRGINIGEAAALFLMTRERGAVRLLGAGSSSDAHHMSSPDPAGRGAIAAMRRALAAAQLDAAQIDYLNLHGTATTHNDAMEAPAVAAVFPHGVPCSSTKSLTGHTLAAAGALEAAFCWLSLHDGRLPPQRWDGLADPGLPALPFVEPGARLPTTKPRRLMSSSFAFGGNNACLILGDAA